MSASPADTALPVATILIADYDGRERALCARAFEDAGWTVIAVSNGREALEAALAIRPDVVSASIFIPDIGGVELCRRLKRDRRTRGLWVMLHSGTALLETQRRQAREAGCDVLLIQGGLPKALLDEAQQFLRSASLAG